MLLAVLLAANSYSATTTEWRRKEALAPAGSNGVAAASMNFEGLDHTDSSEYIRDLMLNSSYIEQLYGERHGPADVDAWLEKLTVVYPQLLNVAQQNALAKRTTAGVKMCPMEGALPHCWEATFDDGLGINKYTLREGVYEPRDNELLEMGAGKQIWLTSKHGHLSVGKRSNDAVDANTWIEVTHCATPHEEGHPGLDAAWFYAAPGSGVSLHVGETVVLNERELEAAGISISQQSEFMAEFWTDMETNLTKHLGLDFWQRERIDTIQRTNHHEPSSVPAYHELVANPKYLYEHQQMFEARLGALKCGLYPHIRDCVTGEITPMQLEAIQEKCG